jgi:hypothetical protein
MPDQPRPGDWPTPADIHAAVVRVDLRLVQALARQEEHARRLDALEKATGKLDGRVDDLHAWRSLVRGGLVLVGLAATAALATGGTILAQSMGG